MDEDEIPPGPRDLAASLGEALRRPAFRPRPRRHLVDPADPELARIRAETEARAAAAESPNGGG